MIYFSRWTKESPVQGLFFYIYMIQIVVIMLLKVVVLKRVADFSDLYFDDALVMAS